MRHELRLWAFALGLACVFAMPAAAEETPKYGGTLTYMIPEDSPPSFDAQREETYATIHSAAPFYSVLVRINPNNPGSATDIVCDLCTEIPKPTDAGTTWTFKIRDDVKFHNGDKLTAEDVAATPYRSSTHRQRQKCTGPDAALPRERVRSGVELSRPISAPANGRNRRVLRVASPPGEGPFIQPTAAVPAWLPELVFMPQMRHSRPHR